MAIAIIPARSGSKRIPNKNVRLFAGKPAIAYPIELALGSGLFERVIVTTDSPTIASISRQHGAEVPFMRNSQLSDDFSTTVEVIADAAQRLEIFDTKLICCLYPVTPLLRRERLVQAHDLIEKGTWDFVFPAIEYTTPIERAFRKSSSGKIDFISPNYASVRTQDISSTYYDAGQFYFGKVSAWKQKLPILAGNSTFITLEKYEVVDIDAETDWEFAEEILDLRRNNPRD